MFHVKHFHPRTDVYRVQAPVGDLPIVAHFRKNEVTIMNDYRLLFSDLEDIKCDECIYYKQFNHTALPVSGIVKSCTKSYCIVIDNHNIIVGIIDITNRTLIRTKSNKHLTNLCKFAKLTMSPKIYHFI